MTHRVIADEYRSEMKTKERNRNPRITAFGERFSFSGSESAKILGFQRRLVGFWCLGLSERNSSLFVIFLSFCCCSVGRLGRERKEEERRGFTLTFSNFSHHTRVMHAPLLFSGF